MNRVFIENAVIDAFKVAINEGYINGNTTEEEVIDNAYKILQFMPEVKVDDLSDEEYEIAVACLIEQLY